MSCVRMRVKFEDGLDGWDSENEKHRYQFNAKAINYLNEVIVQTLTLNYKSILVHGYGVNRQPHSTRRQNS